MGSEITIYQTEDGNTKIQTRLENETVWLTIEQMAELFQKAKSTINEHILNIYKEAELEKETSMRKIGNSDFSTKPTNFYNLDVIISVGYRVKSLQGTKFRQWATTRLKEYIIKGFTMNDELLKEAGGGNYFDELLARIRDIRSSEKVFWRKVLDIYATSIDYDPKSEISYAFFKTVQNKMRWDSITEVERELRNYIKGFTSIGVEINEDFDRLKY
ncbi:cell filamentation protein Fic [Labilibaculum manganireducens]|uniref:Cell filamentation protein Fic n=1 Tax=Labilibaculum manganireducens TaxID=1940525 RepID=A0A2N3HUN2_9BACT|nr:RhuM family protein [Labilibaculum manganireducens]PKQ61776.1 cell filamentation protein Fic [Labilibaculum manganireducens]